METPLRPFWKDLATETAKTGQCVPTQSPPQSPTSSHPLLEPKISDKEQPPRVWLSIQNSAVDNPAMDNTTETRTGEVCTIAREDETTNVRHLDSRLNSHTDTEPVKRVGSEQSHTSKEPSNDNSSEQSTHSDSQSQERQQHSHLPPQSVNTERTTYSHSITSQQNINAHNNTQQSSNSIDSTYESNRCDHERTLIDAENGHCVNGCFAHMTSLSKRPERIIYICCCAILTAVIMSFLSITISAVFYYKLQSNDVTIKFDCSSYPEHCVKHLFKTKEEGKEICYLSGAKITLHFSDCLLESIAVGPSQAAIKGVFPAHNLSEEMIERTNGGIATMRLDPTATISIPPGRQYPNTALDQREEVPLNSWTCQHDLAICGDAYDYRTSTSNTIGEVEMKHDGAYEVRLTFSILRTVGNGTRVFFTTTIYRENIDYISVPENIVQGNWLIECPECGEDVEKTVVMNLRKGDRLRVKVSDPQLLSNGASTAWSLQRLGA